MPILESGLRRGRDEMNETRARLGLAPLERFHGGISELLALVATFPQLEYPRPWPEHVKVTGPLFFEVPGGEELEIPAGDEPLVVVAPSTSQDPERELVRAALEGLSGEPVRVVATFNNHRPDEPIDVPDNAVLTPWLSYSQVMPRADLVICHGGHGTLVRSFSEGVPVLACPAVGDMGENGARAGWSGAGLALPKRLLLTARSSAWRVRADPERRRLPREGRGDAEMARRERRCGRMRRNEVERVSSAL